MGALEDEVRSLTSKMTKLEQERQKAQEELKEALPELDSLRKKLSELKRFLDDEQLKKADLENQCTRLEEDLKFKMQARTEKEMREGGRMGPEAECAPRSFYDSYDRSMLREEHM